MYYVYVMYIYMYIHVPTRRSINLSMAYVARHSMEATKKNSRMNIHIYTYIYIYTLWISAQEWRNRTLVAHEQLDV